MKKTLGITLALLLVLGAVSWAQPGPRGQGGCMGNPDSDRPFGRHGEGMGMQRGGGGIGMILAVGDKINLTDPQRDQLEKMMTEFQTQRVDLEANIEKAEIKLRALMRDDEAAERDVLAAIDDVSRLRGEMQKTHYRHTQLVKGVLTPEQIGQLKEMRQDRKMGCRMGGPGMGQEMGEGMGPGPNPDCPRIGSQDRK